MVREEHLETEIESAGDHRQTASLSLQRVDGLPGAGNESQLAERLDDLRSRRSCADPVADIERNPLLVADLPRQVETKPLLVQPLCPHEAEIQQFPDDLSFRMFDESAVYIEADEIEPPHGWHCPRQGISLGTNPLRGGWIQHRHRSPGVRGRAVASRRGRPAAIKDSLEAGGGGGPGKERFADLRL